MLTLICGHSRAGKTTYSQRYSKVIHIDEVGASHLVLNIVRSMSGDVVVEGIYYRPHQRRELIQAYQGEGKRCIFLDTPKSVREERLGRELKHDYPFLTPTYDEGWDEIIIVRDGREEVLPNTQS